MPPQILWELNSAYDFFISQIVLQQSTRFGLRPSWAAGVRSRLPAAQRETLDSALTFMPLPANWLDSISAHSKDASTALKALADLPAGERLPALMLSYETHPDLRAALESIRQRGSWLDEDVVRLRTLLPHYPNPPKSRALTAMCQAWAAPQEFGERYLQAELTYYAVFYAEEEQRIRPTLQQALERAQTLARHLPAAELVEKLSNGVKLDFLDSMQQVILSPSYWSTPLIFHHRLDQARQLVLFGARLPEDAIEPGKDVPPAMMAALKALADPTRLQILRFLAEQPATPTDLAHRLRLRPPTVTHHLNTLRLAGLVRITLENEGERRYALRTDALRSSLVTIENFLSPPPEL
jgi:DNA-binding transcriptional ArsR family regulator